MKICVVGAGSIGERHLRCFLATGRASVCFVEPNRGLRDTVAARYPGAASFETLSMATDAFDPTVAVIATPAPLHVPLASELVERGAHVLIEKPLAVTGDGVVELSQAVQSRGVIARVAYVYRAHPALERFLPIPKKVKSWNSCPNSPSSYV